MSSSSSSTALLPGFQRLRLFHCLPRFFRSHSNAIHTAQLHKCTLHNSTIQQHRFTLSFCTYSSLYCCISFVKCAVHRMELLIALYFGYFTQLKSCVLQCIACNLSYNVLVGKLTNNVAHLLSSFVHCCIAGEKPA